MGLVKSAAEAAEIAALLMKPRFGPGAQISVEFLTDPAIHATLLPPPLVSAGTATAIVSVGQWQSNCVGAYAGGSVSLLATFDGVEAAFPVAMWMDSDSAVAFGREVFGEPKKLADVSFERDARTINAEISRDGVTLVRIEAVLGKEVPPGVHDRFTFNVRSRTAADGCGLEADAVLTLTRFRTTTTFEQSGTGRVRLASGALDPVGEIPVLAVQRVTYQEHTMDASCRDAARISAETFWPWHLGRMDDPRDLQRHRARA